MKKFARHLYLLLAFAGCTYHVEGSMTVSLGPPATAQVVTPDMGSPGLPVVCTAGAGQNVQFRSFWAQSGHALGTGFRWEWVALSPSWQSGHYVWADGYGGGHAYLDSGVNGNIMFNQGQASEQIVSFHADDAPPNSIFSDIDTRLQHDAYGAVSIVQRQNGVPTGRTFVPAGLQRTVAGAGSGNADLFGSDHSEAMPGTCVAAVRAWDTVDASDVNPTQAYVPQRVFNGTGPAGEPVDFQVDFVQATLGPYADLSGGYDSGGAQPRRIQHVGVPGYGNGTDGFNDPNVPPAYLPSVQYVHNAPFDATYNERDANLQTALARGCAKHAPPAGAKLFDSFCRADQEFYHTTTPDLGSVEYSGISTNLPRWHSGYPSGNVAQVPVPAAPAPGGTPDGGAQRAAVGIYARSPVNLDVWPAIVWAPSNSSDGSAQLTRRPHVGTSSDGSAGLSFRVASACRGWAFFFQNVQAGDGRTIDKHFYLWHWAACGYGELVAMGDLPAPLEAFTQLSVEASGSTITGRADGNAVISITNAPAPAADETGWGLYLTSALGRAYDWAAF